MDGEHSSSDNSNYDAVHDNKNNRASNPQKLAAEVGHTYVRTDHPSKEIPLIHIQPAMSGLTTLVKHKTAVQHKNIKY